MCIQRVSATLVAVAGTGNIATTTITVPATVTFAPGCIYDILLNAQVPEGTDRTIVAVTNGTDTMNLYQHCISGNYARAVRLGSRTVLRVQYFDDPAHFVLLAVRR